jgi:diguanylate cyclase (GGDEF)-like protein
VDALLVSGRRLAVVACSGAWQTPSTVPVHYGIVGRVLATGRAIAIGDASIEYAGLHPGRPVGSVVCAPIADPPDRPVGVLNLEFDRLVPDLAEWSGTLTEIGHVLGRRIRALGGPPHETRAERLLHYSLAFARTDVAEGMADMACHAAVEVSGLGSAALLIRRAAALVTPERPRLEVAASHTAPGAPDLPALIEGLDQGRLADMIDAACRHGASQTCGDPGLLDARGFEPLVAAGVRTLITLPAIDGRTDPLREVALLVMDALAVHPAMSTVRELELLMANAAQCFERLSALDELRALADSDPLTGLGNVRPLGERLAAADGGRTALLVIDIDGFKHVNDTQGHAAGDHLLVQVATVLRRGLRTGDDVFRVGGDEFVAVLDVGDEAEAVRIAGRLATAAAHDLGQSISVGVALGRPGESSDATLRRADEAMYEAKQDPETMVRAAR